MVFWLPEAVSDVINFITQRPQNNRFDEELTSKIKQIRHKVVDFSLCSSYQLKISRIKIDYFMRQDFPNKIDKVTSLFNEICNADNRLRSKPQSLPSIPFLNLYFCCDVDVKDTNGAISNNAAYALMQKVPLLITKSCLAQVDYHAQSYNLLEQLVTKHFADWNIYLFGDLVFFLPKVYQFKLSEICNLQLAIALSPKILFEGPLEKITIKNIIHFYALFSNARLRIVLNGHGCEKGKKIGGFNRNNLQEFMNFLNQGKNCEFVDIRSCYLGGSNILELYEDASTGISYNFPILVRSVGSFENSTQACEIGVYKYFQLLNQVPKKPTIYDFKQLLIKSEIGNSAKSFHNLAQIIFHNKNSTGIRLRPLGEERTCQVILNSTNKICFVTGKRALLFCSHIIGQTVVIHASIPILLSMIPGDAHHLIREVRLIDLDFEDFFARNGEVYFASKSRKIFFISKLVLRDNSVKEHVILDFNEGKHTLFLSKKPFENYEKREYLQNAAGEVKSFNSTIFAFEVFTAAYSTIPQEKNLTATTGLKSTHKFLEQLDSEIFWNDITKIPPDFLKFIAYFKKGDKSIKAAANLVKNLSCESNAALLICAIMTKDFELFNILSVVLETNVKNISWLNTALIYLAIQFYDSKILKYLLHLKCDLNQVGQKGRTPLMLTIINENELALNQLLNSKNEINIDAEDASGETALMLCSESFLSGFELLLERANIHQITSNGKTSLVHAVSNNHYMKAQILLSLGANPYSACPLDIAIKDRNMRMIEILKEKINLDQSQTSFKIAAIYGTPEIIEYLYPAFKNNDQILSEAILEALKNRKTANAKHLIKLGAKPLIRGTNFVEFLNCAFFTRDISLINYFISITQNFKLLALDYAAIAKTVIDSDDLDLAAKFIDLLNTNINDIYLDKHGTETLLTYSAIKQHWKLFEFFLDKGANPTKRTRRPSNNSSGIVEIINRRDARLLEKALLIKGLNLNDVDPLEDTAISIAFKLKDKKACELLLQYGANPQLETKNDMSALLYAAQEGNTEFLELFLKNIKTITSPFRVMELLVKNNQTGAFRLMMPLIGHHIRFHDLTNLVNDAKTDDFINIAIENLGKEVRQLFFETTCVDILFRAIRNNEKIIIKRLIGIGINLEYKSNYLFSPLYFLTEKENLFDCLTYYMEKRMLGCKSIPLNFLLPALTGGNMIAFEYLANLPLDPESLKNTDNLTKIFNVLTPSTFKYLNRCHPTIIWYKLIPNDDLVTHTRLQNLVMAM